MGELWPTFFTPDSHTAKRRHRRRKKSIGVPPPPVNITQRAAAERMMSAQGSIMNSLMQSKWNYRSNYTIDFMHFLTPYK